MFHIITDNHDLKYLVPDGLVVMASDDGVVSREFESHLRHLIALCTGDFHGRPLPTASLPQAQWEDQSHLIEPHPLTDAPVGDSQSYDPIGDD